MRYFLSKLLLPIAATLMLHVNPVSAILVDSVNRLRLAENADLIVVGQVVNVADLGRTSVVVNGEKIPATEKAATVRVLRLLKGASEVAITVVVNYVESYQVASQTVTLEMSNFLELLGCRI